MLEILGWGVAIVGVLWVVVLAFQENPLWGFACLFLPPVGGLAFTFTHWADCKTPFFIQVAGSALIFIGSLMGRGTG